MILFDSVTKSFRTGRASGIKDLLLGSRGRRHRSSHVVAVQDLSFQIASGESVALVGHNGAGKSTTLKLLAGTIQPTRGIVRSEGRIAPLLELGAGFHPDLTGRENIFMNGAVLGLSRAYLRRNLEEIIDFTGLEESIDLPVRFYSSGMYARLGFSVAVHVDPDIVLVDEVLAVGDAAFQTKCLSKMEQLHRQGRTMVLVTHSSDHAHAFADRIVTLEHGRVVSDTLTGKADQISMEPLGAPKAATSGSPNSSNAGGSTP